MLDNRVLETTPDASGLVTGRFAIQVESGGLVDFLSPDPDSIDIEDIALATSRLARYTGHTKRGMLPYSVGQHLVWCSYHVPKKDALEALVHDGSETYTGDVNRPLKILLETVAPGVFKSIEHGLEAAIAEKFGARWPWPESVKRADNLALATEKRDLMPRSRAGERWAGLPHPDKEHIVPWGPEKTEREFLKRYEELRRV